ncbi:MAG: TonB-dependent receptor plug domain-containing protein [Bacteroidota bacterium]|nr:TonB-dependent receptor plug domain-containing protein [Bacteroidota bacterium]
MKKILIFNLIVLFVLRVFAQDVTMSGYVEDASTGERLIGCVVKDTNNDKYVTITNEFGFFSLKIPKNEVKLSVYYFGYQEYVQQLNLSADTSMLIELVLENQLDKVVVTADRYNIDNTQMSTVDVPLNMMKNLPVIFGEVDLLKTLQLMPGVQSGTEGSNGIYVRGGGPDQNLILLDGVPVYNVSHLFGFFSVFNAEALKDVTLYKGGFPARYGGRLSSVIDVRMKDGNMKKLTGSASIGLISSKFTIEGPIKKDTTSFIISARRTYIDVLVQPFILIFGSKTYEDEYSINKTSNSGGYYFQDLNAKITHKLTPKDRLFLSFYGGNDKAKIKNSDLYTQKEPFMGSSNLPYDKFSNEGNLSWSNIIVASRWNHTYRNNLFQNITLTYSRFNFGFDDETYQESNWSGDLNEIDYNRSKIAYGSGIQDFAANIDYNYHPNVSNKIRFGASAIYHYFMPGQTEYSYDFNQYGDSAKADFKFGSDTLFAREFSVYIEDDITLTKWFRINLGTRLSIFNVRDTVFISPEPRISGRILFNKNVSFKASYAKMKQYLHFLTNNTVGLPLDIWVPATDIVVPEDSWQIAAGFSALIANKFTLNVEGFYKKMNNLVEYKEGESIFGNVMAQGSNNSWENKVVQGLGESYGGEIFLRKNNGKFTGWLSYTLSWTNRTFDNINFGTPFSYKYDRRHDISLVMMYEMNKNVNFGFTWVYGSGMPITIAKAEYYNPLDNDGIMFVQRYNGVEDAYLYGNKYYQNRNAHRLPAYHRLDLSVNLIKERKKGTRTWSFGIYNAYSRINPFYTELVNRQDYDSEKTNTFLRVYSIFPIMPSFNYKFVW